MPERVVKLQAACRPQQGQVPGPWLDGHVSSGGCSRAAANAADRRLDVHAGEVDLRGVAEQGTQLAGGASLETARVVVPYHSCRHPENSQAYQPHNVVIQADRHTRGVTAAWGNVTQAATCTKRSQGKAAQSTEGRLPKGCLYPALQRANRHN